MYDDFEAESLDRRVWLPHYLPAWSSLAASRASYDVHDSCLDLFIPTEQGLWCAGEHLPPLRVSAVQSGNYSGPVKSTRGQQPFRPGLPVQEEQEAFWGWTPEFGRIEVRARMELSARSMASVWLVGREVQANECGEICVFEIFGDSMHEGGSAAVGSGLHSFRDPEVSEDFAAPRADLDITRFHTYTAEWTAESVTFAIDGTETRTCPSPPRYPMQFMVAVFDFPERGSDADRAHVPRLLIDRIEAQPRP